MLVNRNWHRGISPGSIVAPKPCGRGDDRRADDADRAGQVGEIGTDWTGNDTVIEAITDPEVKGVTCELRSRVKAIEGIIKSRQ